MICRRDSFITHRAFCDALTEENNKANEGPLPKISSNLQCQPIPANLVVPSLPINTNANPNPQLNNHSSDHKQNNNPLSLPHDLIPKPFTNNNNNNMNMAASGTAFPRNLSSSSNASHHPSLQLSSNSLNIFEENGLHFAGAGSSPHMSATALLQKAAQMGATVSNNSTNTVEKGYATTTSMAPPSFGGVVVQQQQQNMNSSFMNQFMHNNGQQDMPPPQYSFNGMGGMNGVDMFHAILDQSKALSKMIEQNNNLGNNSGGTANNNGGSSGGGATNIGGTKGSNSGDVMTLDLLGIGGAGGGGGVGGGHGSFFGAGQQGENAARDEIWRNWSAKNASFESFSATSSI